MSKDEPQSLEDLLAKSTEMNRANFRRASSALLERFMRSFNIHILEPVFGLEVPAQVEVIGTVETKDYGNVIAMSYFDDFLQANLTVSKYQPVLENMIRRVADRGAMEIAFTGSDQFQRWGKELAQKIEAELKADDPSRVFQVVNFQGPPSVATLQK